MILTIGKKNLGFTLLEVMVTLLLIGLVTAGSIPVFKTFTANTRLKAGARLTLNLFREARADAIANHRNTCLVVATQKDKEPGDDKWLDLQYKAMKIVYEDSSGNYITLSNWEYLPKGIQINDDSDISTILQDTIDMPYPNENGPDTSVGYVQFKPSGATTASGTIRIEQANDDERYKEVTYDLYSGRAKIKEE